MMRDYTYQDLQDDPARDPRFTNMQCQKMAEDIAKEKGVSLDQLLSIADACLDIYWSYEFNDIPSLDESGSIRKHESEYYSWMIAMAGGSIDLLRVSIMEEGSRMMSPEELRHCAYRMLEKANQMDKEGS